MRTYWRTSLFSYVPRAEDELSGYDGYRATVYTFGAPASKRTVRKALKMFLAEAEDKELHRTAWETRQVAADESRGLGFYWVEFSKIEYTHGRLSHPERRLAVWSLPAYEKVNARLGYADVLPRLAEYGKVRSIWQRLGLAVKSLWEWLTY